MALSFKEFVLTDNHIKEMLLDDGKGVHVHLLGGLGDDDERLKLRDSHLINLLSNPEYVYKQKVTSINLDQCHRISDDSLIFIANNFPQLEMLWIRQCFSITDKGIIAIAKKCHNLKVLGYSNCSEVTNVALEAIVSNLPQLEELHARDCCIYHLPDDFGDKLKRLKVLDLRNNNITILPASIANLNLVRTCTDFNIYGNPLSKPLKKASRGGLQGIKRYFEAQKKPVQDQEPTSIMMKIQNLLDFMGRGVGCGVHEAIASLVTGYE